MNQTRKSARDRGDREGGGARGGGQGKRGRGARQTGTDTHWLRCPRCGVVSVFAIPAYKDGPEAWEQLPMLRCDGCQQLSATTAWKMIATAFEPLPGAGREPLRLHPCEQCGHNVIASRRLCRECEAGSRRPPVGAT